MYPYPPRRNPIVPLLILVAIGVLIYYTLKIHCPSGMKRGDDGECVCEKDMQVIKDNKCVCDDSSILNETTQECECPSYATYDETNKNCKFSYYWSGKLSDIQGNVDADDKTKELIKGYSWGSNNYIPCQSSVGEIVYTGYVDINDPSTCNARTDDGNDITISNVDNINVILPKNGKDYVFSKDVKHFDKAESTNAYRVGWGADQKSDHNVCRPIGKTKIGHWGWMNGDDTDYFCISEDYPEGADNHKDANIVEFLYDPEKVKV